MNIFSAFILVWTIIGFVSIIFIYFSPKRDIYLLEIKDMLTHDSILKFSLSLVMFYLYLPLVLPYVIKDYIVK